MAVTAFPPVHDADEDGLLAAGGDLEPESLLLAYRSGIFPWPLEGAPLLWWSPPMRAILKVEALHRSKSFEKFLRKNNFSISMNSDFTSVIEGCATFHARSKKRSSWITREMIEGYQGLFEIGHAYSVEAYDEAHLVGGLYGVVIGRFVSAESMFHLRPNASKLCLFHLCQYLGEKGVEWIDLQVLNPFTRKLGAEEIRREHFLKALPRLTASNELLFTDVKG